MTEDDNAAPTLEQVLQQLAAMLAEERELGRQRMRALGLGESEIDAVLAHAERMHAAQLCKLEADVSMLRVGAIPR